MSAGTIVHLELLSAQFERSAHFYAEVFGWKADDAQTGGHRGFQTPEGPSGSWVLQALAQSSGPVAFVGVADLDEALAAVEKAGGRVLVRRLSLGARGPASLFLDPDGNVMGLAVASATTHAEAEPEVADAATHVAPSKTHAAKAPQKPPAKPRVVAPAKKKKTSAR